MNHEAIEKAYRRTAELLIDNVQHHRIPKEHIEIFRKELQECLGATIRAECYRELMELTEL